ncbi:MAG: Cu(+)/Ag(+) sensor histidine kinase [Gammaproteobacteria bacterium]|nr:Cu(+)/Ag(+) sensor histidine kinase [Gammaproteobacteria bacterium]
MNIEPHQHWSASLALRVTAFVGIATTVAFLVFAWLVERSIDEHFVEQDFGEIAAVVSALQSALAGPDAANNPQSLHERLAAAGVGHHGVFFTVLDDTQQVFHDTAGPELLTLALNSDRAPAVAIEALQIWPTPQGTYRGIVLAMHGYTVLVAMAMDFHLHYLDQLDRDLWLISIAASIVTILVAWFAVQRAHAPIRRISARMRSVTSERMDVRLDPAQAPVELGELVLSFNVMLEKLEENFRRLSHFSADIAHELRTPITNLTTQTQVVLSMPRSAEQYQEILYSNLEELERMGKMVADMLFLAQADDNLIKPESAEVHLQRELTALFEYFEAWAEDRGVSLRLLGKDLTVQGDRLMLRRAFSNLLSNAILHTPRAETVTVNCTASSRGVQVEVENPGPEIPAEHLTRIFDRFYRIDPARQRSSEGGGLGLAIVKSIAQAHGGEVAVESTAGRTRFIVTLPCVQTRTLVPAP